MFPKCQQRSRLLLQQPSLSQVEVRSYKPWLPLQSDHKFQFRIPYRCWHQGHHAPLNPLFLVLFAVVAV